MSVKYEVIPIQLLHTKLVDEVAAEETGTAKDGCDRASDRTTSGYTLADDGLLSNAHHVAVRALQYRKKCGDTVSIPHI